MNSEYLKARKVLTGDLVDISGKLFGNILVSQMFIDENYQRELKKRQLFKLKSEFDIDKCGVLIVSKRGDNSYAVVDGQHRFVAAKECGVQFLPCEVKLGLTPRQEAEVFARQNVNVTKLLPVDIWKSNVFVGNDTNMDVIINNVLKKHGFVVSGKYSIKGFHSLTRLRNHVKTHGISVVEYMCNVIQKSSWENYWDAFGSYMIDVYAHASKKYTVAEVAKVLRPITPNTFLTQSIVNYAEASIGARMKYLSDLIHKEVDDVSAAYGS